MGLFSRQTRQTRFEGKTATGKPARKSAWGPKVYPKGIPERRGWLTGKPAGSAAGGNPQ